MTLELGYLSRSKGNIASGANTTMRASLSTKVFIKLVSKKKDRQSGGEIVLNEAGSRRQRGE